MTAIRADGAYRIDNVAVEKLTRLGKRCRRRVMVTSASARARFAAEWRGGYGREDIRRRRFAAEESPPQAARLGRPAIAGDRPASGVMLRAPE